MDKIIVGNLAGVEDNKISIQGRNGQVQVYPRRELDITLEWIYENIGHPVLCAVRDGVVTGIKSSKLRVS